MHSFIGSHPANVFRFNSHSVTIRPEHILITPPKNTNCLQLEGSLLSFEPLGGEVVYTVKTQIGKIQVKTPKTIGQWPDKKLYRLPAYQTLPYTSMKMKCEYINLRN